MKFENVPLTPSFLEMQLNELQAHINILRTKIIKAKKQHKILNRGTSTYDDVQYHTFQIMLHTDLIRTRLVLTEKLKPCTLSNGTVMTNNGIKIKQKIK